MTPKIKEISGGREHVLTFMVPEGFMQAFKGKKQITVLPCYESYDSKQLLTSYDNPKGITVAYKPYW